MSNLRIEKKEIGDALALLQLQPMPRVQSKENTQTLFESQD
jgi:hypothetical protein